MPNLKILHCPTTVGGNPQGLSRAEKTLGYDSQSITINQNYLNYPVEEVIVPDGALGIKSEIKVFLKAIESLVKYNVIHYNFGQSLSPVKRYPKTRKIARWKTFLYSDLYAHIFQLWDVKIAHMLGKVVAVTYQGSDARQQSYCKQNYSIHFYNEIESATGELDDKLKQDRIKIFEKNADLIYAVNPDLLNVLPDKAKFVPYASVDPREWIPSYPDLEITTPHIIHAPSNREIKGSKYILEAFERLKEEGVNFRFTLIENMSNEQAKQVYKTADLVVDQLLAGYYGAFAVECMALGKPVICFMREKDMKHMPQDMWHEMPVINATPDSVYSVLKEFLTNKKTELQDQGKKSRAYVEKWHDPVKIAKSLLNDYERVHSDKVNNQKINQASNS